MVRLSTDPAYFNLERQEVRRFVPAQCRRVLEVGCGNGRFSASLTGAQETWGVEPSPAAENAAKVLTHVLRGTFDDVKGELPTGYFDLVVCNDVIEHMPDHAQFLRDIKAHIAPGGAIVGSIPNVRFYNNMFEFLLEKDWYYADGGILDRTHLRFFTERSWRRALDEAGYEIQEMAGINAYLRFNDSRRSLIYLIVAKIVIALTAGYFSDIRYLQFGFRARPRTA